MGQFYGEISVIFFLSFRLKTAFSLPFGVFVSTSREREECLFSRGADSFFLKSFFCFSFSSSSLSTFFSQKENKQSSFLSFASLSVFCFFSFVRFTRERLAF